MGEQSASRLEGDRYQHLYSWYELLQLLDADSPYESGTVEHPEAKSADDVTLAPRRGSAMPSKYYQVKWHVDQRQGFTFESLTEVTSVNKSLLKRLHESWRELNSARSVEVWLVSNWPALPELGKFINSRTYKLEENLLAVDTRGKAQLHRQLWERHLGITTDECVNFCRDLRLKVGCPGIGMLEEIVDDRMGRYQLRMGANARADAIDEVRVWIETGGNAKQVTPMKLNEAIDRRQLRAKLLDAPKASLWIHGWAKRAYDIEPTVELDWSAYFDRARRKLPSEGEWRSILVPQLHQAKETLARSANANYLDFRAKLPLSMVMAVGATFPEVGGYKFRIEQPTQGVKYLWRSDTAPSAMKFTAEFEGPEKSDDAVVVFSVTGDARLDVVAAKESVFPPNARFVFATPDCGSGDTSLRSSGDVVALATMGKQLLRDCRAQSGARRLHIVLFGPAAFALFLGMRLNALGEVITYERTAAGSYQRCLAVQTG